MRLSLRGAGLLLAALSLLAACSGESTQPPSAGAPTAVGASLALTSGAFATNGPIPKRYTCDGENISPPLAWRDRPGSTAAFALIMDDPDAPSGAFTHWVLFNMPGTAHSLPEAVPTTERLDGGALQGENGASRIGYTGPCPPSGTHHYHFTLYALDTALSLGAGASRQQVLDAMQSHILGEGRLIGTYQR